MASSGGRTICGCMSAGAGTDRRWPAARLRPRRRTAIASRISSATIAASPAAPIAAAAPAGGSICSGRRAIGLEPGQPVRVRSPTRRIGHQRISSAASTPIRARPFLMICPIPRASSSRARDKLRIIFNQEAPRRIVVAAVPQGVERGGEIVEVEGDAVRLVRQRRAPRRSRGYCAASLTSASSSASSRIEVGRRRRATRRPRPPCAAASRSAHGHIGRRRPDCPSTPRPPWRSRSPAACRRAWSAS